MNKLLYILFLFLFESSMAQNVEFSKENFKNQKDQLKEAKNNIEKGDKFCEQGEGYYQQAIDPYLLAYAFNPSSALLNFKIGKCYLNSNYKLKSIPYLERALNLNSNVDPEIHFDLGKAYHLDMQWDKAITEFKLFQQSLTKANAESELLMKQANKQIEECNNGKIFVKNPAPVFIDNVGDAINSPFPDYRPVISADESVMMFTSRRPNTTGGGIDEAINEYFEDIYFSTKVNGHWTTAQNIGEPINTKRHEAAIALSPDGQTLFLYEDDKGDGNIYESTLKGTAWSKPEKLNKNINTDYLESSASLSSDGKTLYFVSKRADGIGDKDIWMSTLDEKGRWSKAVNLGTTINTPYSEEGVFIHPDGKTLYFSSQGHKSMGGYDIFKSVFEDGKWSEPENLGYPVNTPDDDVFFVMAGNGRYGYYSSFNGKGYGEKDIYMITFLGADKQMILSNEDNLLASIASTVKESTIAPSVEVKQTQLTILKGVITDEAIKKPIDATVEIVDNQKNEVIANFISNSITGKYLVSLPSGKNYGIAVKKDGYLFHSENFDIPLTAKFKEITKDIALKSFTVGNKIILNNIFFDSDKSILRPESTFELERLAKLLKDVPSLKIEVSGHTDSKGANDYNQELSQNRAKAVVDYLIKEGIKENRLFYKGYGKDEPIATNETEKGRQLNRRTEFKVLSK